MDEIIRQLIDAREKANLSLQDIVQRTKIPLRQLEFLESFQYDKIGPAVYVKGFIRRYAQEVGIDPDLLWEQETQVSVPPRKTRRSRRRPRFNLAPALRLGAIVTLLIIVGILIRTGLLTYFQPSPPAPPDIPPDLEEPAPVEPDEDEDPPAEVEPVLEAIQVTDKEAVYAVNNVEALEIVLEYSGKCWTRITADGEKIREGNFTAEQREELSGAKVYRFRFGAPAYVSVTVNGVKVEVPNQKKAFSLELRLKTDTE